MSKSMSLAIFVVFARFWSILIILVKIDQKLAKGCILFYLLFSWPGQNGNVSGLTIPDPCSILAHFGAKLG